MKLIHFNIKSLKCNITKCDYCQEIQKILCYKTLVKPVALYTDRWKKTRSRYSRKILGPKRNNERDYEIRNNEELKNLYDEIYVCDTSKI